MPPLPAHLSKRFRFLSLFALSAIVISYTFFNSQRYRLDWLGDPNEWNLLLAGHGTAPAQYRLGVLFVAGFINHASHGHLAVRYCLVLLDFIFLAIAVSASFASFSASRLYSTAEPAARAVMQCMAFAILLYFMQWTFWYHKPETIANFALLAVAGFLLTGRSKFPPLLLSAALILLSAYLGTIRADSSAALNAGLFLAAFLPSALRSPLGRTLQAVTGVLGAGVTIAVEFYIKHFLYPTNPFSDPLFVVLRNLKDPSAIIDPLIALLPFLLFLYFVRSVWKSLEPWESALLVASLVEMAFFLIVAHTDEVRLYLPYTMVLIPTAAAVFTRRLLAIPSPEPLA